MEDGGGRQVDKMEAVIDVATAGFSTILLQFQSCKHSFKSHKRIEYKEFRRDIHGILIR